jgi:SagB-type dehydrogenase family enzyme
MASSSSSPHPWQAEPVHPDWQRICDEFMVATSYEEEGFDAMWEGRSYDPADRPETYLSHPDALARIPLGEPDFPPAPDLWQTLATRRSKRNFLDRALTLNELNVLLWSTHGITADMGAYQLRTAPSSGALFPVEVYLVVNDVEGLEPGLYHLSVEDWTLEALRLGDLREEGFQALRTQSMTRLAPVNIIWTAVMARCRAKYHERAYRYVWWDSAVVGQNFLLAAHALGLGASLMGSWYDDKAHTLLGIDGTTHFSVLTASVGRVQGEDWLTDRRPPPKP